MENDSKSTKNTKKTTKTNVSKSILGLIKRYNLVIFIVIIVSGLIYAILSLTNILIQPTASDNQSLATPNSLTNNSASVFDQKTTDKLNKLKSSTSNTTEQILPSGRINPFSE